MNPVPSLQTQIYCDKNVEALLMILMICRTSVLQGSPNTRYIWLWLFAFRACKEVSKTNVRLNALASLFFLGRRRS